MAIAAAALSAVAVWELLYNTGKVKNLVQVIGGMLVSATGVMAMYFAKTAYYDALCNPNDEDVQKWLFVLSALPMAYGVFSLVNWLFTYKKTTLNRVCYGFLMALYPAVGFGSMVLLRESRLHPMQPETGLWPLMLLFVIAWVSDTGAYFVGTFLGKHKMAPKISPKKSWEGFFGGWVISVLAAVGLFMLRFEVHSFNPGGMFQTLYFFLPVVIILSPLSVAGDLFASVIKRRTGIKDYGNIMPGHGGVMDRFDSVLFIAPLLCLVFLYEAEVNNFLSGLYLMLA